MNNKTKRFVNINGGVGASLRATSTLDNKYTLHKVTRVNGDDIYQVRETDSDCLFHFYKEDFTHVYINGTYLLQIYDSALNIKDKIKSISFKHCIHPINLKPVRDVIQMLNGLLQAKCPNLYMMLDYMYNMKGSIISVYNNPNVLLLCLCTRDANKCVSSVELTIVNDIIDIASVTSKDHINKKYNKLLRGYIILIANALNYREIRSDAINPISAWLLVNYYNAFIPLTDQNTPFTKFNINNLPVTKSLIQAYLKSLENPELFELGLRINVKDPETIKITVATITKVIQELVC